MARCDEATGGHRTYKGVWWPCIGSKSQHSLIIWSSQITWGIPGPSHLPCPPVGGDKGNHRGLHIKSRPEAPHSDDLVDRLGSHLLTTAPALLWHSSVEYGDMDALQVSTLPSVTTHLTHRPGHLDDHPVEGWQCHQVSTYLGVCTKQTLLNRSFVSFSLSVLSKTHFHSGVHNLSSVPSQRPTA